MTIAACLLQNTGMFKRLLLVSNYLKISNNSLVPYKCISVCKKWDLFAYKCTCDVLRNCLMITLLILPWHDIWLANLKNLCHLCGERSSGQKLTNWVSIPKNNVVFYHIYIEGDNVHLCIFLMNYINTYAWLQNLFVNMFRLAVMCARVRSIATSRKPKLHLPRLWILMYTLTCRFTAIIYFV